ncbi:MAG: hypothetical protein ACRCWG_03635 [Sarcina sp.]
MGLNNNDIDKIKLPDNFDERIKNTVDKTYKQKNKKSKRGKKVAIAAGLAFAVTSGFMIANPEYVEATIQKIREVFKTRNYNVVLEDGTESFEATYKMEHMGVEITFDIDTSIPGIIKIVERIDSSNIKLEDWKLDTKNKNANINTDNIIRWSNGNLEYIFDADYKKELYKKIYEGKDISEELEYIEKNDDKGKYSLEEAKKVQEYYKWGMSDADFIRKRTVADIRYKINGSNDFEHDSIHSTGWENMTDDYYEMTTALRIPEEVMGDKEFNLEVELYRISLDDKYAVNSNKKFLNIPFKGTNKKSSVKYVPIDYSYNVDSVRDLDIYELIDYPDGRIDLLYDFGSHKDKDYKITKFIIENEDGTVIKDTGASGGREGDFGSRGKIEGVTGLIRREYSGEITGDTVKLIPVVTHNTNQNVEVDEDEPILKELQPIIVKVK